MPDFLIFTPTYPAGPFGDEVVFGIQGPPGPPGPKAVRSETYSWANEIEPNTGKFALVNDDGVTRTISRVRFTLGAAAVGSSAIFAVKKNGTTIFNTPPTLASGQVTAAYVPTVTAWADEEYLTIDIVGVGASFAGSDLSVTVTYS